MDAFGRSQNHRSTSSLAQLNKGFAPMRVFVEGSGKSSHRQAPLADPLATNRPTREEAHALRVCGDRIKHSCEICL
jgi:hypothetical protein